MNFQNVPQAEQVSRPSVSPERSRRVTFIVGGAVVGVLALLFGYNLLREHMVKSYLAANKPPPVSVTYETVATSTLPQSMTAVGSITAVHQVDVSPEVDGAVTRILFKAGDTHALARAVVDLLGNTALQPQLKAAGRHFVEEVRNWRNSVANYAPVYERLVRR